MTQNFNNHVSNQQIRNNNSNNNNNNDKRTSNTLINPNNDYPISLNSNNQLIPTMNFSIDNNNHNNHFTFDSRNQNRQDGTNQNNNNNNISTSANFNGVGYESNVRMEPRGNDAPGLNSSEKKYLIQIL